MYVGRIEDPQVPNFFFFLFFFWGEDHMNSCSWFSNYHEGAWRGRNWCSYMCGVNNGIFIVLNKKSRDKYK